MSFSEYTRTYTVQAEQIEENNTSVITQEGAVTAQEGQWEVRHPDGRVQVMDDDEFQDAYGDGSDDDSDDDSDEDSDEDSDDSDDTESGFVTTDDTL